MSVIIIIIPFSRIFSINIPTVTAQKRNFISWNVVLLSFLNYLGLILKTASPQNISNLNFSVQQQSTTTTTISGIPTPSIKPDYTAECFSSILTIHTDLSSVLNSSKESFYDKISIDGYSEEGGQLNNSCLYGGINIIFKEANLSNLVLQDDIHKNNISAYNVNNNQSNHNNLEMIANSSYIDPLQIKYLGMCRNGIRNISRIQPPFWINLFPNLSILNLSHNSIDSVERNSFEANSPVAAALGSLETLDLSYNKLTVLTNHTFTHSHTRLLLSLKTLNLSHNLIREIGERCFASLLHLEILILSYNRITSVPSYLISYPQPNPLLVSQKSNSLTTNLIDSRKIKPSLRIIRDTYLRGNKIWFISPEAFLNVTIKGTLDLSENELSMFQFWLASLKNTEFIGTLKLSSNTMEALVPFAFDHIPVETLHLAHLKKLKFIDELAFNSLRNLKSLKLSHNRHLKYLSGKAFRSVPELEDLDLSHNALMSLNQEMVNHLPSIGFIDVRHNPLVCDCQVEWIYKALMKREMAISISQNDSIIKCFLPLKPNAGNDSKNQFKKTLKIGNSTNPGGSGGVFEIIEEPVIPFNPVWIPKNSKKSLDEFGCNSSILHEILKPRIILPSEVTGIAIPCRATTTGHTSYLGYDDQENFLTWSLVSISGVAAHKLIPRYSSFSSLKEEHGGSSIRYEVENAPVIKKLAELSVGTQSINDTTSTTLDFANFFNNILVMDVDGTLIVKIIRFDAFPHTKSSDTNLYKFKCVHTKANRGRNLHRTIDISSYTITVGIIWPSPQINIKLGEISSVSRTNKLISNNNNNNRKEEVDDYYAINLTLSLSNATAVAYKNEQFRMKSQIYEDSSSITNNNNNNYSNNNNYKFFVDYYDNFMYTVLTHFAKLSRNAYTTTPENVVIRGLAAYLIEISGLDKFSSFNSLTESKVSAPSSDKVVPVKSDIRKEILHKIIIRDKVIVKRMSQSITFSKVKFGGSFKYFLNYVVCLGPDNLKLGKFERNAQISLFRSGSYSNLQTDKREILNGMRGCTELNISSDKSKRQDDRLQIINPAYGISKRYTLIVCIILSLVFFAFVVFTVVVKRLYASIRIKRLAIKSEKLSQQLFFDNMDLDDKANERICEEIRLTFENRAISPENPA